MIQYPPNIITIISTTCLNHIPPPCLAHVMLACLCASTYNYICVHTHVLVCMSGEERGVHFHDFNMLTLIISRAPDQNGISRLYNMLEIYHSGAEIAQLVVLGLAVHSVAGSILLWGLFPVEGIFPLELTWVQTPFPPKLLRMRV